METLLLKAKTRQVVAEEYGINVKTLNKRLKAAGIHPEPGILFPNTLKMIYFTFGIPPGIKK